MPSINLDETLWNCQIEGNGVTCLNHWCVQDYMLHNKSGTTVSNGQIGQAAHGKQQTVCSKTPMALLVDTVYLYIGL